MKRKTEKSRKIFALRDLLIKGEGESREGGG